MNLAGKNLQSILTANNSGASGSRTFRPEPVPSGIPEIDTRIGGLPRGAITEVFGEASAGKTKLMLSSLREMVGRLECAAIVDITNSFDPSSAENTGLDLDRILWIRCSGKIDAGLKSADYLIHAGGFGIVVLDFGDVRRDLIRKLPVSYWFRFRIALENTSTVFLLLTPVHCAGSSCSESLEFVRTKIEWSGLETHFLLRGFSQQVKFHKTSSGKCPRAALQCQTLDLCG